MSSENKLYAYIHGQIVPLEQAFLHVSDLAVQRGYGIFEFFKVQNGYPFFLEDYLDRFYKSAHLMDLPVPLPREELKAVIHKLIGKNALELSGVKMVLTGGYSPSGYEPVEPNLIITQQSFSLPGQAQLEKGIKIITHEYVREVPPAKTINYSIGIRLIKEIKAQGADDVLYHTKGVVTEFPRCNFFIVKQDDTIVTPARDVLYGITRKNVLELARNKCKVEEGVVTFDDIAQAKEAFLTSTTKRIIPIVQVNDKVIGDGKSGAVTLSLLKDLLALEEKQLNASMMQ
jgi:branched-chain amino acid aminotransferase